MLKYVIDSQYQFSKKQEILDVFSKVTIFVEISVFFNFPIDRNQDRW